MSALRFLREAGPDARRALLAASLGWMLDSMDTMLYALALPAIMQELSLRASTAGLLQSLTQVAGACGGVLFGVLADRIGRTRALIGSVLVYSLGTFGSGLAPDLATLALCRLFLGLGTGGEWAAGASLVAESFPAADRGKALGLMQSSWAVGYGLAALLTSLVLPRFGWRAVFLLGVLPALLCLWVRRSVAEPALWQRAQAIGRSDFGALLRAPLVSRVAIAAAVNAATLFAWWGLFTWLPSYLALPESEGGAGLGIVKSAHFVIVMQVGMWFGYVSFGYVSDWIGRRASYVGYLTLAALLVPIYGATRDPLTLLLLGPLVAFFGTGYFSGFGAITAELFPTRVRATAQGATYNLGRLLSAIAPYAVGKLAEQRGLGVAFLLVAAAFALAALLATRFPETRGAELE